MTLGNLDADVDREEHVDIDIYAFFTTTISCSNVIFLLFVAFNRYSPHRQLTPIAAAPDTAIPSLAEAFTDDPLEREPEILAEQSVDAGIYRGVAVAQPEKHAEDGGVNAVGTIGAHQVHREEGKPAKNEPADDDPQSLCRLGLHAKPLHLPKESQAPTIFRISSILLLEQLRRSTLRDIDQAYFKRFK